MSSDDILYLRKNSRRSLWAIMVTLIPTAIIIIWSAISAYFDIDNKADKEYVDKQCFTMHILISNQQVSLANYIKAGSEDKVAIWKEIHRNQDRINKHNSGHTDITRGKNLTTDKSDSNMLTPITSVFWY